MTRTARPWDQRRRAHWCLYGSVGHGIVDVAVPPELLEALVDGQSDDPDPLPAA